MKNKYDDIVTNKLYELYKTFEEYVWKNEDERKIIIVYRNDMTLSCYLYDNNEVIDELDLKFDIKEELLYQSICLKLFILLLGNVYIYKEDDVYFNIRHKKYLGIVVDNNKLNKLITSLVANQNDKVINKDNDIIKDSLKIKNKVYSKKFINELDSRIELSKKMLRGW